MIIYGQFFSLPQTLLLFLRNNAEIIFLLFLNSFYYYFSYICIQIEIIQEKENTYGQISYIIIYVYLYMKIFSRGF